MLPDPLRQRIIPGNNGVFMPTIVVDGQVIGTWKRVIKARRIELHPLPFSTLTKSQAASFVSAGKQYANFLNLDPAFPPQTA